jgi:hypothetical protein
MPSLHFGWAVIVALCVTSTFKSRWVYLVWLHPILTLLAIVITGNHYWADAMVAGALVIGAELLWRFRTSVISAPTLIGPPLWQRTWRRAI